MPTAITLRLTSTEPLFFDETRPLEARFLDIMRRAQSWPAERAQDEELKPYALSPLWRAGDLQLSTSGKPGPVTCRWLVCLLDDALQAPFLQGLEATEVIDLNGALLAIGEVKVEECTYQDLARRAQVEAAKRPHRARHLNLEFLTPVVLYRSGLPLPLPDPVLVFRRYLSLWDTFAPRELWRNFNLLDAVQFHVALTEHRLETRRVRWDEKRTGVGFLGSATYVVRRWEKLGAEFLANVQMLARFGTFCGTGLGTARGLGQTRFARGRR
jgi:CRISPR-associated endoribonuclease Cas6